VIKLITRSRADQILLAAQRQPSSARAGEAAADLPWSRRRSSARQPDREATDEIGIQICGHADRDPGAVGSSRDLFNHRQDFRDHQPISAAIEERAPPPRKYQAIFQRRVGNIPVAGTIAESSHGANQTGAASNQLFVGQAMSDLDSSLQAEDRRFLNRSRRRRKRCGIKAELSLQPVPAPAKPLKSGVWDSVTPADRACDEAVTCSGRNRSARPRHRWHFWASMGFPCCRHPGANA